jgi:hypothetical protein
VSNEFCSKPLVEGIDFNSTKAGMYFTHGLTVEFSRSKMLNYF